MIQTNVITILLMRTMRLRGCHEETQVTCDHSTRAIYLALQLNVSYPYKDAGRIKWKTVINAKCLAYYEILMLFSSITTSPCLREKKIRSRLTPFPRQSGDWDWGLGFLVPWAEHHVWPCLPWVPESGNTEACAGSISAQGYIGAKKNHPTSTMNTREQDERKGLS